MKAETLINLNNEKRQLLNSENLKYYEDMLVYIRLSYNKSEQETEEILMELLDHLLEAQAQGKTAKEVFGTNPKEYADEIIGELPQMMTKKRILYITMAIFYFLAASIFFSGVIDFIFYLLGKRELTSEIFLGTVVIKTLVSIPLVFVLIFGLLQYLRWACFKKVNKVIEFGIFWLFGALAVGLFMLVTFFTPKIGSALAYPLYFDFVLGVILFAVAHVLRKRC